MSLVLFGRSLPPQKHLIYALTTLYGLGINRAREICRFIGLPPTIHVSDLTPAQEQSLAKILKERYVVAGNLEEEEKADIYRLTTNTSQRGYRLRSGLPVRGQRTRSNSKTSRRLRRFKS
jgi:small subunit ribosomal protein S13